MRLLATLIVVALVALPSVFAGWPGHNPAAFAARVGGVPASVIFMSLLMAVFVGLAGWCSRAASRDGRAADTGGE